MFISENQHKIMASLRHGPLDPVQIHVDTQLAPFTVRAELQALKRERLVYARIAERAIMWELTHRGMELANGAAQLEIVAAGVVFPIGSKL